jgi:3-deoxy-D-manno-octulosonic-acid transferase
VARILLAVYRLFAIVVYGCLYPLSVWKRWRGSDLWSHRFGRMAQSREVDVWVHAASIGEVKVARNLIAHLLAGQFGIRLHLSVMTSMGHATAIGVLPKSVTVSYLMLDAPPAISRGLDSIRPRLFVFTETEIWPNLLQELARRNISVILANARMSEKTHRWYHMVRPMMCRLFSSYDRFHYRTTADADRYESLGAPATSGSVTGDMKFDAPPHKPKVAILTEYRSRLKQRPDERIIVAGSTRPGEEEMLMDAFTSIRESYPKTRLVIAPRHIERSIEIMSLANHRRWPISLWEDCAAGGEIVIVDKVGILSDLYAVCDIAFVGGTLVEKGGHNLLEPVWAGRPVLFGPYTANVGEASQFILQANLGCQISNVNELSTTVIEYFSGRRVFATPDRIDAGHSATHLTGEYILGKLSND